MFNKLLPTLPLNHFPSQELSPSRIDCFLRVLLSLCELGAVSQCLIKHSVDLSVTFGSKCPAIRLFSCTIVQGLDNPWAIAASVFDTADYFTDCLKI